MKITSLQKNTVRVLMLLIYLVVVALALVTLLPVIYALLGSFRSTHEILTSESLWPGKFIFDNYRTVWNEIDFSRYTMNSVMIAASTVAANLFFTSMTAFALDRKQMKLGKIISKIYVASIFISVPVATIYPIFSLVVSLNLNSTIWGLVLVGTADVSSIFLVQGYLRGISKELDESAKLDGCGFFRTYWNIIMPLCVPILAVVALLTFRGSWNSYLMPMVFTMGNRHLTPLTVAVVELRNSGMMATNYGVMLAGTALSLVPMLIVYFVANKQFVAGLTEGAIKG